MVSGRAHGSVCCCDDITRRIGTEAEGKWANGVITFSRGPLLFCLLLSFFLSRGAQDDQKSLVFSGVFTMVWLGEAVVTLQIKLLGGNM